MADSHASTLAALPSVDRLLRRPDTEALVAAYGRVAVTNAIRGVLEELRAARAALPQEVAQAVVGRASQRLEAEARPSLRPVFNLTGTVLHTNLGRAPLPEEAIEALRDAARDATNLEYDLASGKRGERDHHVERQLCALTGAEAATVVNNNAAAVLLVLNTLAQPQGGARLARRTDRDRRLVPLAGHHAARGLQAARSRHHQPHAP